MMRNWVLRIYSASGWLVYSGIAAFWTADSFGAWSGWLLFLLPVLLVGFRGEPWRIGTAGPIAPDNGRIWGSFHNLTAYGDPTSASIKAASQDFADCPWLDCVDVLSLDFDL